MNKRKTQFTMRELHKLFEFLEYHRDDYDPDNRESRRTYQFACRLMTKIARMSEEANRSD